jgi:alpha amylase-like protein
MTIAPDRALGRITVEPHHDGSELHVLERPDELGGEATVRVRMPRGTADRVLLRYARDGEPRTVEALRDEETADETWWRATFPVYNPSTRYRWLLAGGEVGWASLTGNGLAPYELPSSDDYVLALGDGPDWHLGSVVYQVFPDRFASSGTERTPPPWAVPRAWGEPPTGRGPSTPREWYGGDLLGIEQHLDHVESLGANVIYMTPIFPAGSTHRYDATTFDHVDPLLGGDEALASLARAAHGRGMKLVGDLTPNHTGVRHEWFRAARESPDAPERAFYYFDPSLPNGYEAWLGVPSLPKLDWRSAPLRERMRGVVRHWLDAGLDGWRIDVANMTGRFRDVDLNHDAARWIRASADGALIVAEHGHDFRPDLDGTGWHGVMNYSGFLRPTWWWLRDGSPMTDVFSGAPAPAYDGAQLVHAPLPHRHPVAGGPALVDAPRLPRHAALLDRRRVARAAARRHRAAAHDARRADDLERRRARRRRRVGRGRAAADAVARPGVLGRRDVRRLPRPRPPAPLERRARARRHPVPARVARRRALPARDARRAAPLPRRPRRPLTDHHPVHAARNALRRRCTRRRAARRRSRISRLEDHLTWPRLRSTKSTRSTTTASRPSST